MDRLQEQTAAAPGFSDFLAFVPITIPGIVMGMALILLYVAFPIPIYGTIWVLLIAYVTRFIPYGMRVGLRFDLANSQ